MCQLKGNKGEVLPKSMAGAKRLPHLVIGKLRNWKVLGMSKNLPLADGGTGNGE